MQAHSKGHVPATPRAVRAVGAELALGIFVEIEFRTETGRCLPSAADGKRELRALPNCEHVRHVLVDHRLGRAVGGLSLRMGRR